MSRLPIKHLKEGVHIDLLSPIGVEITLHLPPGTQTKRFFTDHVLAKEPGKRAMMHYISGDVAARRRPLPDERFD